MSNSPEVSSMDSTTESTVNGHSWFLLGIMVPLVMIISLAGLLIYLFSNQAQSGAKNDRADVEEWLEETRVFRKTLPEIVREYIDLYEQYGNEDASSNEYIQRKREEISEQIKALTDPLRIYVAQLPLFLEVYHLRIDFSPFDESKIRSIRWDSPIPRPRKSNSAILAKLDLPISFNNQEKSAIIHCEYRIHAFNRIQHEEERNRVHKGIVVIVVLSGLVVSSVWILRFLRRERMQQQSLRQLERARMLMLAEKLRAQEAEREQDVLKSRLLEQELENERQSNRLKEAEYSFRSQLFAGMNVMAGSYAHNIKNLLVRPNDLLVRCLNMAELKSDQVSMLQEVQDTLGVVTDRLQQILRTVRRDLSHTEMTSIDLNQMVQDCDKTWTQLAREKWKVNLNCQLASSAQSIQADLSHLLQALENLLFNARDATYAMRNHLRDQARLIPDIQKRRQAILDAASWRGEVSLRVVEHQKRKCIEVEDNGIGMDEEVKQRCTETHFTTKKDNALYQGLSAGMGLGLSFVSFVLDQHQAQMEIESHPFTGTIFRIIFPSAEPVESKKEMANAE